ncbi:type II toxin-antitoxin system RelE/ParE family toxin [Verrucomicrobia bacterium]|nr:type II toxin-antitoxin system RelE/ParE family toxin [Verrucomicrobiota bacterium]MDA7657327.1 type II toxin-antitoxin system RelE/ParE family toxin [Verrucomicrobiota bacterium]MDA7866540.1 type II toxin-antitoxin system RelE/ParE family toxin [Verrucomicrobiota bacterium]
MAGYVLSPQANADLVSIYEYTLTTWGVEQFHVYRKHLENALSTIATDPMLRGSKARDDILRGCRFLQVEHHYIVYRLGKYSVEVGRILHERMHFEQLVGEDAFGSIEGIG